MNPLTFTTRQITLSLTLLLTLSAAAGFSLIDEQKRLRQISTKQQQSLHTIRQMANEIQSLRREQATPSSQNRPLLSTLEQAIKRKNLHHCAKQIRPDNSQSGAEVTFSECNFNQLLQLIQLLEDQHHIFLSQGNFIAHEDHGKVNATLRLGRQP